MPRLLLLMLALAVPVSALAQPPRVAPRAGYTLLDEQGIDRFVVQRWASPESPRDSLAGFCECITLVFEGSRLVLDLGMSVGYQGFSSLGDVTGDRRAELAVVDYSGGAHCCETTTVFSVGEGEPVPLLSVATGNCMGEFTDLDGDGRAEFETCDDRFAYEFCSFAVSPLPPVVYAYDADQRRFVLATPRFAARLSPPSAAEIQAAIAGAGDDVGLLQCAALRPALHAIYTGSVDEGLRQFRAVYGRPDAAAVETKLMQLVTTSELWTAR